MTKTYLLVLLVSLLLPLTIGAQTPNPTFTPSQSSTQASSSPSIQTSPVSTSVKVSTSGIELSGFPTWIIGVVLAVAFVAFLIWFYLLRSEKAEKSMLASGGLTALAVIALLILGGYWLGRRGANQELQQTISSRAEQAVTVSVPLPTPIPQASLVSQAGVPVPFYIVLMGFLLLVALETSLFMYIYWRWGRGILVRWDRYRAERPDRPPEFEDYVLRRLDRIDESIARVRSD